MECVLCGNSMFELGCKVTDRPFWWCSRCGSMKTCDGVPVSPVWSQEHEKLNAVMDAVMKRTGKCGGSIHLSCWAGRWVAVCLNMEGQEVKRSWDHWPTPEEALSQLYRQLGE